jgi:hypothetical protein
MHFEQYLATTISPSLQLVGIKIPCKSQRQYQMTSRKPPLSKKNHVNKEITPWREQPIPNPNSPSLCENADEMATLVVGALVQSRLPQVCFWGVMFSLRINLQGAIMGLDVQSRPQPNHKTLKSPCESAAVQRFHPQMISSRPPPRSLPLRQTEKHCAPCWGFDAFYEK